MVTQEAKVVFGAQKRRATIKKLKQEDNENLLIFLVYANYPFLTFLPLLTPKT